MATFQARASKISVKRSTLTVELNDPRFRQIDLKVSSERQINRVSDFLNGVGDNEIVVFYTDRVSGDEYINDTVLLSDM